MESNKTGQLCYCLAQVIPVLFNDNPLVAGFYDVVHVNEKRFYVKEVNQQMLLMSNEEPPHRTPKSKKFISYLMGKLEYGL